MGETERESTIQVFMEQIHTVSKRLLVSVTVRKQKRLCHTNAVGSSVGSSSMSEKNKRKLLVLW